MNMFINTPVQLLFLCCFFIFINAFYTLWVMKCLAQLDVNKVKDKELLSYMLSGSSKD